MKIGPLQLIGSLVLLACMAFATAKLDSADEWVSGWLPFVIAGAGLVYVGTLISKRADGGLM